MPRPRSDRPRSCSRRRSPRAPRRRRRSSRPMARGTRAPVEPAPKRSPLRSGSKATASASSQRARSTPKRPIDIALLPGVRPAFAVGASDSTEPFVKSRRLSGRLSSGVPTAGAARRSSRCSSPPRAGGDALFGPGRRRDSRRSSPARPGGVFGPLCRRPDGALEAFTETRSGRARLGTFAPGSEPRWRRAPRELIAAHYSPACDRVVEVYYSFGALIRPVGVRLKAAYRGEPWEVAWSPDGTRVAVMMIEPDYGSTIRVFDARTGRRLARRPALGDLPPQAFSPDGNAVDLHGRRSADRARRARERAARDRRDRPRPRVVAAGRPDRGRQRRRRHRADRPGARLGPDGHDRGPLHAGDHLVAGRQHARTALPPRRPVRARLRRGRAGRAAAPRARAVTASRRRRSGRRTAPRSRSRAEPPT